MSAPLVSVREDTDVIHLLPIFARKRFHHLPVVDADKKIVGIVTLPALMAVLHDEAPLNQA
jgi:CBS-domain-containing membrane protein